MSCSIKFMELTSIEDGSRVFINLDLVTSINETDITSVLVSKYIDDNGSLPDDDVELDGTAISVAFSDGSSDIYRGDINKIAELLHV